MPKNILAQISISKDARIPIYQQLESQLESLIVNGTWRLRDPLPSETLLARRWDQRHDRRQAMWLVNKV